MKRLVNTSIISLAIAAGAYAADKPGATTWDREPDAVMGIALGKPVSSVPMCADSNPIPDRPAVCISPGAHAADYFPLLGLPFRDIAIDGSISTVDDNVRAVTLFFRARDFDKFSSILVERYGKQTSSETNNVISNAGARLPARTTRWEGRHMTILCAERVGEIDQSVCSMSDNALTAEFARRREEKSKADASKL